MSNNVNVTFTGDMTKLHAAIIRASMSIKRFASAAGSAFGGLASSMASVARSAARIGLATAAAGIAAAGRLAYSSTNTFMGFEDAMAKVLAVSGATSEQFRSLVTDARRLGEATRYSSVEVAGLQLEFSKLGFTSDEILKVTEGTLALAQASGSDLARSAEVAGGTLRGFGLAAEETGRVTDVMALSFSSSALDLEKFLESVKYVAPVARASNVSLEQTTAMLSVLADNMVSGSMAGTSLRRIITDLAATGKPFGEALQDLADKGLTLTDANDEVGRTAQTSLLILSKNMDKVRELATKYDNAGGSAKKMASIMDDTMGGAFARLSSAWEEFKITVGEDLAPMVNGFVEQLQNVIEILRTVRQAFQNGEGWSLIGDVLKLGIQEAINVLWRGLQAGIAMFGTGLGEAFKLGMQMLGEPHFWDGVLAVFKAAAMLLKSAATDVAASFSFGDKKTDLQNLATSQRQTAGLMMGEAASHFQVAGLFEGFEEVLKKTASAGAKAFAESSDIINTSGARGDLSKKLEELRAEMAEKNQIDKVEKKSTPAAAIPDAYAGTNKKDDGGFSIVADSRAAVGAGGRAFAVDNRLLSEAQRQTKAQERTAKGVEKLVDRPPSTVATFA